MYVPQCPQRVYMGVCVCCGVQVIARQLLFDERPAAHKLLQEVLLVSGAPSIQPGTTTPATAPTARRLNLQLLQELLQLAAAEHSNLQPAAHVSGIRSQPTQFASLQPHYHLAELCQQKVGLSARVVAEQLSSPGGAAVRSLLAQLLVSRWERPQQQHQQQGVQQQQQKQQDDRQQHDVLPAAATVATSRARLGWFSWLVAAGTSGVKLVVQLCVLMVAVMAARAVRWLGRCVRKLCAAVKHPP